MMVLWTLLACAAEPPRFPDPVDDLLSKMDADGSRALDVSELRGDAVHRVMAIFDRDKDERLERTELRAMMARVGSQRDLRGKAKAKAKAKGKMGGKARPGPEGAPPGAGAPQVPGLR